LMLAICFPRERPTPPLLAYLAFQGA
jgi:hypothetical protein